MSIFDNLTKNKKNKKYMQAIWKNALLNQHATYTI